MAGLKLAWKIVRDLGPSWAIKRAKFALQARLGILERRLPVSDWDFESRDWLSPEAPDTPELLKYSIGKGSRFFRLADRPTSIMAPEHVCRLADRVLAGEWPYFSHQWLPTGFPPDWHANPVEGTRADGKRHWSHIELDNVCDVKFIWEPSRFSPVYLLVRAYSVSREEKYPEAFWKLIEDWAAKNRPNQGVNWASGQEAALRVMAWCFGLYAFWNSPASTADRVTRLVCILEKHAERIDGFIEYAISQRNNHGVAEAVGLFTIGLLFPQLRRAGEWRARGRDLLVSQLDEQIYPDGSYIQHSFNYERAMMDLAVWALRLAELAGDPFPNRSYDRIALAAAFMLRFCDRSSGKMPNYGGNDGTLTLPLTSCDYSDFRPTIQAACYLTQRASCFEPGPWDELSEWLFGEELRVARHPSSTKKMTSIAPTGYIKIESEHGYAMLRAGQYRNRPAQADQLHVDLWWRGENVLCDPGSYLYSGAAPWQNTLAATSVHNTIMIGDRDQMTRAGKFLWVDWANAEAVEYGVHQIGTAVEASHGGYRRLGVLHRRSVLAVREADAFVVVDDLIGKDSTKGRLHWLFPDCAFEWCEAELRLQINLEAGKFQCFVWSQEIACVTIVRAGDLIAGSHCGSGEGLTTRGWRSLYYGVKEAAISLATETSAGLPQRFVTVLAPEDIRVVHLDGERALLHSRHGNYQLAFSPCHSPFVFRQSQLVTTPDRPSPASVPLR